MALPSIKRGRASRNLVKSAALRSSRLCGAALQPGSIPLTQSPPLQVRAVSPATEPGLLGAGLGCRTSAGSLSPAGIQRLANSFCCASAPRRPLMKPPWGGKRPPLNVGDRRATPSETVMRPQSGPTARIELRGYQSASGRPRLRSSSLIQPFAILQSRCFQKGRSILRRFLLIFTKKTGANCDQHSPRYKHQA